MRMSTQRPTLAFERRDWCRISKWKKSSGRQAGKVVGDGGGSLLQARQWRRSGADLAAVLAASRAPPERIGFRVLLAPRRTKFNKIPPTELEGNSTLHTLTSGKSTNMRRHEQGLDMEHGLVSTRGSQRWLRAMAESLVADAGEAV
jgi:hypothetical protein